MRRFTDKRFYNRETFAWLNYKKCLSYLPFHLSQIIYPFLNSSISSNHNRVERLSANGEIFIKGIASLLYNLFCSQHPNDISWWRDIIILGKVNYGDIFCYVILVSRKGRY